MSCPTVTEEYISRNIQEFQIAAGPHIFFCFACGLGSVINLIAIIRYRSYTPHVLLVAALTFADIFSSVQSAAMVMHFNYQPGLVQSCQTEAVFSTYGVLVAIISFGMITIERYLVICHGLQNHINKTVLAIITANLYAITTASISGSSPDFVDNGGFILCHPKYCSRSPLMFIVNISFVIVLFTFLISIIYCPYKIMELYYSKPSSAVDSIRAAEIRQEETERKKKERKVFFKLSIVTIVFVIMLGPLAIALIFEVASGTVTPPALATIYGLGVGAHSCLNPYLFYIFDISITNRVNRLLRIKTLTNSKGSQLILSKNSRKIMSKQSLSAPSLVLVDKRHNLTGTVKMQEQ